MTRYSDRFFCPVSFQLRFQELTFALVSDCKGVPSRLPASLPLSVHNPTAAASQPLFVCLQATVTLWNSLQRCWDDSVLISSLAPSFVTANAQMLGLYCEWLRRDVCGGGVGAPSELLVAVANDCTLLAHAVTQHLVPTIVSAVGVGDYATTADRDCADAVTAVFATCTAQLHALSTSSIATVTATLVSQCGAGMAQVAAISTEYRVKVNKPMPTKPSPFVLKFLKPLSDFVKEQGEWCFISNA